MELAEVQRMGWRDTRIHGDVHDVEVLREIELCAELIIVASNSDRPLTTAEIDAVLGLSATGQDCARRSA